FTNTKSLKPGTGHKITAKDLPQPMPPAGRGGGFGGGRGAPPGPPEGVVPLAPAGFKVAMFVGPGVMTTPRQMRRAPNGDIFVADTSGQGGVKIFRGMTADGKPQQTSTFATFPQAFGINFYPPGPNPQWVYVSNTTTLVRYAYKNGDLTATGMPETLITGIPAGGGHTTRDIVFSQDGKSLFLAVGSASNNSDNEAEFHR